MMTLRMSHCLARLPIGILNLAPPRLSDMLLTTCQVWHILLTFEGKEFLSRACVGRTPLVSTIEQSRPLGKDQRVLQWQIAADFKEHEGLIGS